MPFCSGPDKQPLYKRAQSWVVLVVSLAFPTLFLAGGGISPPGFAGQGIAAADPGIGAAGAFKLLDYGAAIFFGFLFFLLVTIQLKQVDALAEKFLASLKAEQDKHETETRELCQSIKADHQACRVEHNTLANNHGTLMERMAGVDKTLVRLLEQNDRMIAEFSRLVDAVAGRKESTHA